MNKFLLALAFFGCDYQPSELVLFSPDHCEVYLSEYDACCQRQHLLLSSCLDHSRPSLCHDIHFRGLEFCADFLPVACWEEPDEELLLDAPPDIDYDLELLR